MASLLREYLEKIIGRKIYGMKITTILLLAMISFEVKAVPVLFEFIAEVSSIGSSTSFKCDDTATFTCNTQVGLWVGDRFSGSIYYDTDETTQDTWYWGGARYNSLTDAGILFNINGGILINDILAMVYNDAPYNLTDGVELYGGVGEYDMYMRFGTTSSNTIDSLSMPDDLAPFLGEYDTGYLDKTANQLGFHFIEINRVDVNEPYFPPMVYLSIFVPLMFRKRSNP